MASSAPLRVGFIGAAGRWGPRAHIPALKQLSDIDLYAFCTAHADTAQAAAEQHGVPRAYGDDQLMNANKEVEAVCVAVRVPKHFELTRNALEAGKHVYCEWPLGATLQETEELAKIAREMNVRTMVGLQRRASPAYMRMRELVQEGYVGKVLSVHMMQMGSGVLTRTSDRTWQKDVKLGANTLTITFGHSMDALCMVAGELTEVAAVVSTQVPQWRESDTGKFVDVTSPDNILLSGRLESGAVVSAHVGVHPYHGSGYRLEVYGTKGALAIIGGGEAGQEAKRMLMGGREDDKSMQPLEIPERLKWVPEGVRTLKEGYDVGQMWVNFAKAIRTGERIEPDFDSAVRRHRMLDAIQRASETGQRQKIAL
ncbi:MAG TPA: Gfo/Idh/MocA family oxidoreductase [Burkholderiales bacterium]|nr:Gfo/Idh/MocA family oxidoreductase [Burkholderiales bacterium]